MHSEIQQQDNVEIVTEQPDSTGSRLVEDAYSRSPLEKRTEPLNQVDSSDDLSLLDRLPEVAKEAAANGKSSVLIGTGRGEMVGAFLPRFESEQLDAQVKRVEALGFDAQVRWLENGAGTGFVYELSASWDAEHHPELAQVTAAAMQEKAEELAAKKETLDRCDNLFAIDAATALDQNRLPEASRLIKDCGVESTGLFVNAGKFQQFLESVSANEEKGKGLDVTLKYGVGRGTAFYLAGIEIK
ncbi:MAG: hypothetical protein Q8T09_13750 [Candidatus Melainabacteria bacterium]|nr:hypothetical protein [Candidatus Melainabacteria bacterium]